MKLIEYITSFRPNKILKHNKLVNEMRIKRKQKINLDKKKTGLIRYSKTIEIILCFEIFSIVKLKLTCSNSKFQKI